MNTQVYIEGNRLDLYSDESISVTQGVQNVKDISKIFADFSQTFTVPASANNNNIFKHYYNANIDGGFDARTRKSGYLTVNTLDFKRGKIQLEEVNIKNNEPENYKITFFGDAIKIKDDIGDDRLYDLDWLDNFNHDYTDTNVKTGLTTGLNFTVDGTTYNKAVIYPLISYKRQYFYDSDPSDTTSTDTLVNIAYDSGRTDGVSFTELKPAIKLSLVIKAIEEKYGFNFTGAFFDSTLYEEIYMNLNNSSDSLANGYLLVEDESGTQPSLSAINDRYRYSATITPKAGFEDVDYKFKLSVNDQEVYSSTQWLSGTQTKNGSPVQSTLNYTTKLEVFTQEDFEFDVETTLLYTYGINNVVVVYNNSYTDQVIDLDSIITSQLKDIKVYDFLTSFFKMFNLVVVPDGDDLYVRDIINWYAEGRIFDISQFVDTQKEVVKKGKIYNEFDFSFEDSEQILADEFEVNNNVYYGNIQQKIYTDETQTEQLDGDTLEVNVVFENPIFERLFDLDDNSQTTVQYCPYFNRERNTISGNPFLLYAPSTSVASNPIGYKGLSTYEQLNGNIFMPSHSQQIDIPSFNLNFNAEINEYTSQVFLDTIYDRFYSDYISDIFSVKRRLYVQKALLPLNLLVNLKLNDRLVIKGNRYLINSITSNLVKREDSLELINDIYDAPLATDELNTSYFRRTAQEYNYQSQTDSFTYIGTDNLTISRIDTGDGITWINLDQPKSIGQISNIKFTLNENNTGSTRYMQLKMVDGIKNPSFIITQYPN